MSAHPTFPAIIPHDALTKVHAEYDGVSLGRHEALYLGGRAFEARLDDFLVRRKSESDGQNALQGQYEQRKRRAHYVARAAGLIDWLVAAVFCHPPRVVCSDPAHAQYWDSLNIDADGLGHPLAHLCREALLQMLVHKRGYFCVSFPDVDATSLGEQMERGGLDASLRVISAASVDDWQRNENGSLEWVRVHSVTPERPTNFFDAPSVMRHTWRFIFDGMHADYELCLDAHGNTLEKSADGAAVARQTDIGGDGFPALPVYEVMAPRGMHIMDRIEPVAVALFNRDATIAKYLDDGALQVLVLKLENPTHDGVVVLKDITAVALKTTESADFLSIKPHFYKGLRDDAERLRAGLYEVVQAMAMSAASLPQAGRLSGAAVSEMRDPLNVLLESLAWPVHEALTRLVRDVAAFRGEDPDTVTIEGFDRFEATLADAQQQIGGTSGSKTDDLGPDLGDDHDGDGDGTAEERDDSN